MLTKEKYEPAKIEIIKFQAEDVLTTSCPLHYDENRYETPRY